MYFQILRLLLKSLPDNKFKSVILSLLLGSSSIVQWPQIELAPQEVDIAGTSLTIKLVPHLIEQDLGSLILKTFTYEKGVFEYLEQHIKDYDAVIEIGANVGLFTMCLAKWFARSGKPNNNIFSFEPSREAYLRLLRNLELNRIKEIQTFNLAVGERDDFVNFYEPAGHLTNGSLYRDFAEIFSASLSINKTFMINGNFLDGLVQDSQRILLKINAEGSEYTILQTMKDFIIKRMPAIIIEVLSLFQNQLNQLDFLFSGQYSFFNITDQGLQSRDRFIASNCYSYLLLPLIEK
jgi:FkbM family methyltransferase